MKYQILSNISLAQLIKSVNEICEKGYRPLGGVVFVDKNSRNAFATWYQAVYKEDEKKV